MVRKSKKRSRKEPSWSQIGGTIATKIEKEAEKNPPKMWTWSYNTQTKSHFLSALIFAIAAMWSLDTLGYTTVLPLWTKAILVLAFAFMYN